MVCRLIGWGSLLVLAFLGACSNNNPGPVAPPATAPQSASGLYSARTSTSRISLRWRDNSDTEQGFRVERREISEPSFTALADTVPANRPNFEDRTVEANKTYSYRVLAYSRSAFAKPSNEIQVQAVQNQTPGTPVAVRPQDGTSEVDPNAPLTLEWASEDLDGDPIRYEVRFGASLRNMAVLDSGTTANSVDLPGTFSKNSHYFWQVVAKDPKGVSSPSPVWGFNTVVDRRVIPGGLFFMGAEPGSGSPFVHPGNPVSVDSSYTLDTYEVTNLQYADFLNQMLNRKQIRYSGGTVTDAGGEFVWAEVRPQDLDSDLSFSVADSSFIVADGRESFPVAEVSWYGADSYARFYQRRLPTEAEWERAARGDSRQLGVKTYLSADSSDVDTVGVGFPFPWGAELELDRANVLDSGDPYENQGRVRTTPIGFYDGTPHGGYVTQNGASPYGVADMAGNLWEWCQDWYEPYHSPHRPPLGGHDKVLRGGSFNKPSGSATTYNRSYVDPQTTDRAFGFRTAGPASAPR